MGSVSDYVITRTPVATVLAFPRLHRVFSSSPVERFRLARSVGVLPSVEGHGTWASVSADLHRYPKKEDLPKWHRAPSRWFNAERAMASSPRTAAARCVVHYSAIDSNGYRSLDEAQRVEFEVTQGPKGPQADRVRAV